MNDTSNPSIYSTSTPTSGTSSTETKPSLLFVDDEPAIIMALRVVFRNGYQVTTTTDAHEAVELLKTKHFDVIVSDQRMPHMTGVELLSRACELAPKTVRILLTGYSDPEAMVGAINEVEVHRFLKKPWDNEKIKHQVDEAIALSRTLASAPEPQQLPQEALASSPASLSAHDEASPDSATSAPPSTLPAQDKDAVLIIDAQTQLLAQAQLKLGEKVSFFHARHLSEVFKFLETSSVSAIVSVFDVQSEADRTFLQMLKQTYPRILVIAVCDSLDSIRLIELINHARIYRLVRQPINWALLARFITSALVQVHEFKKNPLLIQRQTAEAPVDTHAAAAMALPIGMTLNPALSSSNHSHSHEQKDSLVQRFFSFFKRR
jgi:serine/threonine-protein kinase